MANTTGAGTNPQPKKDDKTIIILTPGEITNDGTTFKITIEARVKKGAKVVENTEIRFKKGINTLATKTTDTNGETVYEHKEPISLAGKLVKLKALLSGTDAAESDIEITFPDNKKKQDYSEYISIAEIKPIGQDGIYCINIQAVNQHGFGNKCSLVITDFDQDLPRILPVACDRPPIEEWSNFQIRVRTSDKGFVSVHLHPFTEKERRLQIRVKGTTIDREIVLSGPKEKMEFRPKAGFWKNLKQEF